MYRKQYRYDDHDFERTLAAMSSQRMSIARHARHMLVCCAPAIMVVAVLWIAM